MWPALRPKIPCFWLVLALVIRPTSPPIALSCCCNLAIDQLRLANGQRGWRLLPDSAEMYVQIGTSKGSDSGEIASRVTTKRVRR
jgi:hypothetical protein